MMNIYIKLLGSLLTFIPLVSTSQVIDNKIIINASKVNLRLFPNDSSKIICQIIGGEEVTMVNSSKKNIIIKKLTITSDTG